MHAPAGEPGREFGMIASVRTRIVGAVREPPLRAACAALVCCLALGALNLPATQSQDVVAADATPVITSVQPSGAAPGSEVTLQIQGQKFATGSYVSFSDPAIHVLNTKRVSDAEIEAVIAVGAKAQPGSANLFVANPSGASAQTAFSITAAPSNAPTTAPASTTAPEATTAPPPGTPVVTEVKPSQAEPGAKVSLKITGKNFVKGTKIAFANPGIRVLETKFNKTSQLTASIQIASDAPTGESSLFVVNPDESEAEIAFHVGQVSANTSTPVAETGGKKAASAPAQQFNVANLGNAISILQSGSKPQGLLIVTSNKLTYQEDGKNIFAAGPNDIQEIAPNILFGINTDTFHVILKSGKRYNFVAASLRPEDTGSILSLLHQKFK